MTGDREEGRREIAPVDNRRTAPTKGDALRHMADRFHGMPDVAADLRLFAHEIDRLQRWQREALAVLDDWDSASAALLDEIERLRADLAAAYCRMDDMETMSDDQELPDILSEDLGYLLGWVALGTSFRVGDEGCEAARAIGEAVVGCEEMRAIRAVLRHLAKEYSLAKQAVGASASKREVLSAWGLSDICVEWVLS